MSCPYSSQSAAADAPAGVCPFSSAAPAKSSQKSTTKEETVVPIPQPPVHWFTRNIPELNPTFPAASVWRLAEIYGDIYKLDLVTHDEIVVSSHELINECLDDDRFEKQIEGGLKETRALLGDGLFTAYPDEPNWFRAHRILMPVFGPLSITKMFPQMHDMIGQMVMKWDRQGPENEIVTADDFTILHRLAFDTIAYCAFSYRFNSFYHDNVHPFAQQMADVLIEAGKRANRTSAENYFHPRSFQEALKNIDLMWKLCDDIVADRHQNPQPENKDLLNAMLYTADPETGEKLTDESIRFNMVTFLAAGHETTSGTLSFLFHNLLKHPENYYNAQAEVDRVLGDDILELKHLPQLKYIEACIKETLRYQGPISRIQVHAKKDTVIGGKYKVPSKDVVICNLVGLHHDARVWGDDAYEFRPERFLDGTSDRLPPNSWKPFGSGARACIGRAFAEQEMLMATAMILQRFKVTMADPSYDLKLKSTLTVKPDNFKVKVTRRPGKDPLVGVPGSGSISGAGITKGSKKSTTKQGEPGVSGKPLLILYGTQAGTCKYLAEDLETIAQDHGFNPSVQSMDSSTDHLPTDCPVVIITPSYEGKPADNAKKFVAWLELLGPDSLKDVKFALFGVGNSEWASTFHKIPKLLDTLLPKLGAQSVIDTHFVDVKGDLIGPWEDWRDELLTAVGGGKSSTGNDVPEITVSIEPPETAVKLAGEEIAKATVKSNTEIVGIEVGSAKRHMEIQLPQGVTYQPGDYMVILPTNPPADVNRAADRFNLNLDDIVKISGSNKEFLTGNGPASVHDILAARVELGTPASKRQVEVIAKTANESEKKQLLALTASDVLFNREVIACRRSTLDILEEYPTAKLPFAAYLDMLKPLSPRQYSISSSPLATEPTTAEGFSGPVIATVTYDVHEAPARSGHGRVFRGVGSTYLASRVSGSTIRCFVRRSNSAFNLPTNPSDPIILLATGTGVAPMRGFVQERACLAQAGGQTLGPALLYYGCRDEDKDFLYKEEMQSWEKQGVVSLRPAFSRHGPTDCEKYVQDRMWTEREELRSIFGQKGAKIFLCGSASKLAKSAGATVKKIWLENNADKTDEDAQAWFEQIKEVRYVSDVFD